MTSQPSSALDTMPAPTATAVDVRAELIREVSLLLAPLRAAADDPIWRAELLAKIGWNLDGIAGFPTAKLETLFGAVRAAVDALKPLIETPTTDLKAYKPAFAALKRCFDAVRALKTAFDGWGGINLPDAPALGTDLVNLLVVTYLQRHRPVLGAVLWALALVDGPAPQIDPVVDPATGKLVRFSSDTARVRLDRLPALVGDPVGQLREHYLTKEGLATREATDAVADLLLPALGGILNRLGSPITAVYGSDIPDLGDSAAAAEHLLHVFVRTAEGAFADGQAGFELVVGLAGEQDGGLGLMLAPKGTVAFQDTFGDWTATVTAALQSASVIAVGPDGLVTDLPDATALNLRADLGLVRTGEMIRIGGTTGTRLEIDGPVQVTAFAELTRDYQDFGVEFGCGKARLIVSGGDGDGFLGKVLPDDAKLEFDLGIGWSRRRGLFLTGGAALKAHFDVRAVLGDVARLDSLDVDLVPSPKDAAVKALVLRAVASGQVRLGPVGVTVQGVGMSAKLSFPDGGGNLGPADLDLGFQPPHGVALRIDGGAVTGAGFLSYDAEAAKYAGGIDLEFAKLRLSALGLLATRMPDGRPGFSLLVVINAQFPKPIPLGFGFNLAAVGGIVGVNRAVNVDRMRSGLRSGSLGAILAPGDVLGNERRLLDDLDALFPVTPGRHLFGPTARLTWGVPTVVTIDLALALELPKPLRFIAAGRVRTLLPDERKAVAVINMDALGVLDTGEGTLSLDATLYDSQLAGWRLSGDMALRARWSGRSEFVMSAGGFHPRFTPPVGFPALRRMTMEIGEEKFWLRLQAYLALTSNTLQFGARVDFHAETGDFTADGHFTFDALVRFSPFGFELDLTLAVAIRWKGKLLLGITADLYVTGPGRWQVRGHAEIKLLFLSATVRFKAAFGQQAALPPAPPEDVSALVRAALAEPGAWQVEERAALPALTMRAGITLSELLVSPSARVSVRQKIAPVGGMRLDHYGQAPIDGAAELRIDSATLGGALAQLADVKDEFAPAQFFELSDDQKLTGNAFDLLPSGVSFTATDTVGYDHAGPSAVVITYQTKVIDEPDPVAAGLAAVGLPKPDPTWVLGGAHLNRLAYGGAAGRAATRATGLARFAGPGLKLTVRDPGFVIVAKDTLRQAGPVPATGERWSRSEAADRLRRWATAHPDHALMIVPAHEAVTGSTVSA
ncbi:hypothetical protein Cs7R123_09620 [Catellatospora sp. TT07R-123]|uniref:DUF6603 domain-containing protein n=1 Tax=Catellatospora sp. TT07R-123 TaxID=2733863 RepID=UPI001B28F734|nr:DUF6603 domain-containing protein [Catellatospora sp. TT07R-123]GHJ43620.1 hypothetical protein Cs7R123_09620 [Catellatospora sp. TT07R-123]